MDDVSDWVRFDDYAAEDCSFFGNFDCSTSILGKDELAAPAASILDRFDLDSHEEQMPIFNDLNDGLPPFASISSADLGNLGLGLGLGNAMRPQKRIRLSPDLSLSPFSSTASSAVSSEFSTPMTSPSLVYQPALFGSSPSPPEQPKTELPPRPRAPRKQSESRIPLPDLHARMGLAQDPDEARAREQHILGILQDQGFPLGERTWIRDTEEKERRRIIEEIYRQTKDLYGYERALLEVIVRRGAYYLMQGRLRRLRRSKRHVEDDDRSSRASSEDDKS